MDRCIESSTEEANTLVDEDRSVSTRSGDTESGGDSSEETKSKVAVNNRKQKRLLRNSEKLAKTLKTPVSQSKGNDVRKDSAIKTASSLNEIGDSSSLSCKSLKEQILFAGAIVAQALCAGPWPSPVILESIQSSEKHSSNKWTKHKEHMSMVGASLRRFCEDTVLKSMSGDEHSVRRMEPCYNQRPFLGTLLMIREVLSQNYYAIFGGICREGESIGQRGAERVAFTSRALATSVILYALQEQPRAETISDLFLKRANEYDESRGSFAGLLSPYLVKNEGSTVLDVQGESFAFHARKHPLVAINQRIQTPTKRRRHDGSNNYIICLPDPNAVHITILRSACSD